MDVLRRPRKPKIIRGVVEDTKETGSKLPKDYIKKWRDSGGPIWFNGNVNATKKGFEVGVCINDSDVTALFSALVERGRRTEQKRCEALQKICTLIDKHRDKAPSQEDLIKTIRAIAEYGYSHYSLLKTPPHLRWIEWDLI